MQPELPETINTGIVGTSPIGKCPVCGGEHSGSDEFIICKKCETPHHRECWDYIGGCAIFGCRKKEKQLPEVSSQVKAAIAPISLRLLSTWKSLFEFHWSILTVAGDCFALCSLLASAYGLLLTLFSYSPRNLYALDYFFFGFGGFIAVIGFISFSLYILLFPFVFVLRLYLHSLSFVMPSNDPKIIDSVTYRLRIDGMGNKFLEQLSTYINFNYYFSCLMFPVTLVALLFNFPSKVALVVGTVMLLITRLVVIPLEAYFHQSRITLFRTFQNRIESTQLIKGGS